MGCKFRDGIDCSSRDECYICGWNPEVEKERKEKILKCKTESMIIAELKHENAQLHKLIMTMNKDPKVHPLIVHWVD